MKPVKASVIIFPYNSERTIYSCLKSIVKQDFKGNYEIIVVDCSKDNTPKIVALKFPFVRLLHFEDRKSPVEAANIGINHARGEIILFLGSDLIADRDWLRKRIERHDEGYAGVAGAIKTEKNQNIFTMVNHFTEFSGFTPTSSKRVFVKEVPILLSYNRVLFDKYGLFQGPRGAEDIAFNWKLVQTRELILFDPSIQETHLHPLDFKGLLRHRFTHGKSQAIMRQRGLLPGPRITRRNFLMLFLFPLAKYLILLRKSFKEDKKMLLLFLGIWLICVAASIAWALGYYRGVRLEYKRR